VTGLSFSYTIRQEEGEAALYIDRGPGKAEENKEILDRLQEHKEAIEKTFGAELSWQPLENKQSCRVASIVVGGGYRSAEAKWPEIQGVMIETMIRLEKALAPHLSKPEVGVGCGIRMRTVGWSVSHDPVLMSRMWLPLQGR
jgi:hypothetical protein